MKERVAVWRCENGNCGHELTLPWPGALPNECDVCKGVTWFKVLVKEKEDV